MPRGSRREGKKIEYTRWLTHSSCFQALAAGSVAGNVLSEQTRPYTLMRTRGKIAIWKDGLSAPALGVIVSIGILKVPAGTTATVLQEPFNDGAAPWLFYGSEFIGYEEMVTDVIDVPGITSARLTVDSKAMRIVRPEEELQIVITNTNCIAAMPVNISVELRFLLGF